MVDTLTEMGVSGVLVEKYSSLRRSFDDLCNKKDRLKAKILETEDSASEKEKMKVQLAAIEVKMGETQTEMQDIANLI